MRTWGYLKNVILAKLDLDDAEASAAGMSRKFPFYANEAITQICSAVMPRKKFYEIEIKRDDVGKLQTLNAEDFISFGDDVCTVSYRDRYTGDTVFAECNDTNLIYKGYNQFICLMPGTYLISYNAYWCQIYPTTLNEETLDAPNDVLDCIPSYVASQCYKVDDEYKSSVFRNEFEMAVARIDNTDFNNTKDFVIKGGW